MRRSLSAAFLALLTLGGCARRTPSVFVDLEAIARSQAPGPSIKVVEAEPPPFVAVPGITQSGLPSRVLRDQTKQRMQAARALIDQNREKALRDITRRLRAVYQEEAERMEERRLLALEPEQRARREAAQALVRDVFDRYAERRAPLIARLAFLAGFPDPDPNSRRLSAGENLSLQRRLDEARDLRARLAEVDASYEREVGALLGSAQATIDQDLTALRTEIEAIREGADRRARDEATRQVRASSEDLGLTLASRDEILLPEVPGRSAPTVSAKKLPEGPKVRPTELLATAKDRREALERELAIWLAVKGYERAKVPSAGRDATEEFRKWRESHRHGR